MPSCIDRRTAVAVHKYGGRMQTAGKAGSNTRSIDGCGRQNMKEVNSASSSLEIEVELEDVLDHTRIRMDMDMENTVSPRAGHAKGRAEVKLNDNLVSSNMEIYQVEEGDKYVTYSSLYEQWSRTESENSASSGGTETDFSRVQERKSKLLRLQGSR